MKNKLLLTACCIGIAMTTIAQGTLKGKLMDTTAKVPLGLATVTVFKASDTAIITYRLSDPEGNFKIPGLPFGLNCRVVISYSGYNGFRKEFILKTDQPVLDLGNVSMARSTAAMQEVVVYAERPPVVIRQDTVEFNASAFKTLPDALVEDLLKKLPGVEVDKDGNIMVNGKPVNRILVDGKTFFGDDPKMATRNLPANIIDKVQVTDDKDELMRNGDDNLNNVGKVVNITLKKGVKKGWFGKLYVGGGTQGTYEAGGIANIYRDTLQVSLLGYLNDLNKPGFSYGDLSQAGGLDRSRSNSSSSSLSVWNNPNGSGLSINGVNFGGSQNYGGVTTSKGYGININHTPSTKRSFFIQYFRGNVNVDRTNTTDISQYNADTVVSNHTVLTGPIVNNAHNIAIGLRLKPDSVTNILLNASYTIGLQHEERISDVESDNNKLGPLSDGHIFQDNPGNTYYYKHNIAITRLSRKKKGRRFNFNQTLDINNRYNDYSTESNLNFLYPSAYDSLLSQLRVERIPRTDATASFNYSEPLAKQLTLRLGGRYEYSQLYNSVNTFNKNASGTKYDILNDSLSSSFKRFGNRVIITPGIEYKWKGIVITPGTKFLFQSFDNTLASLPATISQSKNSILPTLNIVYKQLNINYNKDVVMPAYTNLIPVTDNTNPYLLTKGNTALLPAVKNNFSLGYNYNNPKSYVYIYLYTNASFTNQDVIQSITVDNRGVQTIVPVNADGSKNFSANFNVNKQYKNNPKRIFSWNFGGYYGYNRNELLYNSTASWQSTFNFNTWCGFGLNFNDKVEWNASLSKGINFTRYTTAEFQPLKINTTSFDNEIIIRAPKHLVWETQFNGNYNSSLVGSAKRIFRWNAAFNYTLLNDALVLKFSVFDILNSNKSLGAYASRNMTTINQTNTLPQYGMLTATYNVRPYGSAKKKVGGREKLFFF